jgi:hypothetical protein
VLQQKAESLVEVSHVCAVLCNLHVHHSLHYQNNKECCQANFKALKHENGKTENFATLAAPQTENQCLLNFACNLLVTRGNFYTLLESLFFYPPYWVTIVTINIICNIFKIAGSKKF